MEEDKPKRITAGKAVRRHCVACVGGVVPDVHTCGGEKVAVFGDSNGVCLFMPHRLGKGRVKVKLIRQFCLECQGNQQSLVRECHETACHFHAFRMGRSGLSRAMTDEQKDALRDRLSIMRENRVSPTA